MTPSNNIMVVTDSMFNFWFFFLVYLKVLRDPQFYILLNQHYKCKVMIFLFYCFSEHFLITTFHIDNFFLALCYNKFKILSFLNCWSDTESNFTCYELCFSSSGHLSLRSRKRGKNTQQQQQTFRFSYYENLKV